MSSAAAIVGAALFGSSTASVGFTISADAIPQLRNGLEAIRNSMLSFLQGTRDGIAMSPMGSDPVSLVVARQHNDMAQQAMTATRAYVDRLQTLINSLDTAEARYRGAEDSNAAMVTNRPAGS